MNGPFYPDKPFDKKIIDSIFPCERLVDVGPGIRPFDSFKASTHLCIEPHWEYVKVLSERGYPVVQATALEVLPGLRNFETILFIDVIEHMTKADGWSCLYHALSCATKQVVVFTPLGFMDQSQIGDEPDPWGYSGWEWQTHQSGWTPEEFRGWDVSISPRYHGDQGAFAAVWNV
jgi:hypothetical protein